MTIRQLLLLAITPAALFLFGLGGLRSAQGMAAQTERDSIVAFVEKALDRPDKVTPEHVASVLRTAATLEAMERNARASALATFESFAAGCLGLSALGAATVGLAAAAGRHPRAET